MKRLLPLLLAFALAGPALGATPVQTAAEPSDSPAEREHWVERIRSAQTELGSARERHDRALAAYRQMRHRASVRGAEKAAVMQEREEAKAALSAAESNLEELLESARRAGVPPGWIRDAMEPEPASPTR